MKKFTIPLITLIFTVLLFGSCKQDCDMPSPNIYGSWTVLQTDSEGVQFNVELKINTNNTYDWILLDSVEGHGNSHAEFTLTENLMTITNDADCSSLGEYYMTVEANKLAIISKTDGCAPRATGLEWVWIRK